MKKIVKRLAAWHKGVATKSRERAIRRRCREIDGAFWVSAEQGLFYIKCNGVATACFSPDVNAQWINYVLERQRMAARRAAGLPYHEAAKPKMRGSRREEHVHDV